MGEIQRRTDSGLFTYLTMFHCLSNSIGNQGQEILHIWVDGRLLQTLMFFADCNLYTWMNFQQSIIQRCCHFAHAGQSECVPLRDPPPPNILILPEIQHPSFNNTQHFFGACDFPLCNSTRGADGESQRKDLTFQVTWLSDHQHLTIPEIPIAAVFPHFI